MMFAPVRGVLPSPPWSPGGVIPTYGTFMVQVLSFHRCLWLLIAMGASSSRHRILICSDDPRAPSCLAFSPPAPKRPTPKTWTGWRNLAATNASPVSVLPMGYSFNLDGSADVLHLQLCFIAQAYGIELSRPSRSPCCCC